MPAFCSREPELLDLVRSGGWPLACDPELQAHVAACRRCSDLLLVTLALRNARSDAIASAAPLPDPGILWWRAQLRRRSAALEQMNRPLARAQGFALVIAALALVALVVTQARHGLHWLAWAAALQQSSAQMTAPLQWLASHTSDWALVLPALAMLLFLGGMAAWLAVER